MIVALQQICILLIQLQIVNRRPEARGYWTYAKSITAECRRTKENPRATRSALVPNRRKPDATKLLGGAALAEASAAPTAQDHQPRSGGTRTRRERPCGRGVQRRLQTGRCSRGRRGRCRSSRRSSRRRRLFGSRLLRSGSLLRSRCLLGSRLLGGRFLGSRFLGSRHNKPPSSINRKKKHQLQHCPKLFQTPGFNRPRRFGLRRTEYVQYCADRLLDLVNPNRRRTCYWVLQPPSPVCHAALHRNRHT